MFHDVERPIERISTFWAFKKAIWTKSRKWFLNRRMAQRTRYLPSGRLRNTLLKSMKQCFNVSKGHMNTFSASCASKNRLGWSRLSDVLYRRMTMKPDIVPSERLKIWLMWCRWSDVSWCRNDIRTNFQHSGLRKTICTKSRKLCFK
jgi:hypothetical protein